MQSSCHFCGDHPLYSTIIQPLFNHYSTIIQPFLLVKPWFSPHLFHPSVKNRSPFLRPPVASLDLRRIGVPLQLQRLVQRKAAIRGRGHGYLSERIEERGRYDGKNWILNG